MGFSPSTKEEVKMVNRKVAQAMPDSIKLEELAQKYENKAFISDDPIQFPHRFQKAEDIEIAAFISSLFAYGNRKVFIKKLDELFEIMKNKPHEFVLKFYPNNGGIAIPPYKDYPRRVGLLSRQHKSLVSDFGNVEKLKGFNYRFAKDFDIVEVFNILNKLYTQDGGLKKLFEHGYNNTPHPQPLSLAPSGLRQQGHTLHSSAVPFVSHRGRGENKIQLMLQTVTDYFYANVKNEVGQGFYHLIPNPQNGGAMKRMNMLLRWMVRKGPVDLGVWDFIPTSELLIPLDVHVARLSREMKLLNRSSNDFKAVIELSEKLREICPQDPVKYDFAIFGLGVNS